jgi:hypothetical protein
MSWVENELGEGSLGDRRLTRRAKMLLDRLVSQPSPSLPTACRGWGETQAAYRFFDNAKVTDQKVLAPHREATQRRMGEHEVVLCLQDTTELDYSGQTQTQGLGPLSYENQRGLHLHPTLAVTPERLCLGVLDTFVWARTEAEYGKSGARKNRSIEEKESLRWIEGYQNVCRISAGLANTQCVYIGDRESDIYELFIEGEKQSHQADWLIRATQDRRLLDEMKISDALVHTQGLGEIEFNLPVSHPRERKRVKQTLKACRVTLRPPQRSGHPLDPVEVSVLVAQEIDPPKGEEPVTWILLTNLEVASFEQAIEKIQWYLCRWQIEIYFRILKGGCKIEKLQLEHIDRLRPAIALYMIVAWRVLYLTMLGRECPDLPCDLVFDREEWHAIYIVNHQKAPPVKPPTINTILRMMAGFGGFLGRRYDGEPGPQTVWIGLQRARDFVLALQAQNTMRTSKFCV